jgi:hypothetical protein
MVATAASHILVRNRISTAYTSTAVASPARCWASGMIHSSCSSSTGTSRTE